MGLGERTRSSQNVFTRSAESALLETLKISNRSVLLAKLRTIWKI